MYREALEMDPQFASAHYNLAASLTRSEEFAEAEAHFQAVIDKQANSQAYTGLGFVQWKQGRPKAAAASLREAIKADPNNASAYNSLGALQIEQGKLEEAVSTYEHLIENQPSATAHEELAKVLSRLGRAAEAQKEMAKARAEGGAR